MPNMLWERLFKYLIVFSIMMTHLTKSHKITNPIDNSVIFMLGKKYGNSCYRYNEYL